MNSIEFLLVCILICQLFQHLTQMLYLKSINKKINKECKMDCIGCKYYDDSVDACNGDDLCPVEEYKKGVDELKSNCIVHIQEKKPLTIEEIIKIIQYEADVLKRL